MEKVTQASPYDLIAGTYDDLFGDQNPYYGQITAKEREVFDSHVVMAHGTKDALDIGCGTGVHTQWLVDKGYNTVGIDTSMEMLKLARAKSRHWSSRPEFIYSDALDMAELESRSFDVITCLGSTLNHVEDWRLLSRQVSRHLRPGGQFIFSFDNNSLLDTLVWLIKKEHSGYSNTTRWRHFVESIRCLVAGRPYENHWRMTSKGVEILVSLRYETIGRLREYLTESHLWIDHLAGVHLLSFLTPSVLSASASLDRDGKVCRNVFWRMVTRELDDLLSNRYPRHSAIVIGAASKNR